MHVLRLQGNKGEEGAALGNGHGSGPSLVELGMALERPASAASTGSAAQKAALGAAALGAQSTAATQKSPKAGGLYLLPTLLSRCEPEPPEALHAGNEGLHTRLTVCCMRPAGASRERERNSFFDSLRRKSRSPSLAPLGESDDAGEDAAADAAAAAVCMEGASAAEPDEASEPISPAPGLSDQAAATPGTAGTQQHTPPAAVTEGSASSSAAAKQSSSGSLSERLLIPAEEEAFLRSLGWEGSELGEDGEEGACQLTHTSWGI